MKQWIILTGLALAGCGGEEPGGVTAAESRQLDEAAEMLDAQSDDILVADETGLANGDAPVTVGGGADDAARE